MDLYITHSLYKVSTYQTNKKKCEGRTVCLLSRLSQGNLI